MRNLFVILVAAMHISCSGMTEAKFNGMRLPLTRLTEQTDLLQLSSLLLSAAMVERRAGGYGTAFCVSARFMVTNYHVVYNKATKHYHENLELVFFSLEPNGYILRESVRIPVRVVRVDENNDLALLAPVDNTFICQSIPLAAEEPETSEFVWRFGFNNGWRVAYGVYRSITDGHMNAFEIHDGPGASGGPIINIAGELVGITTRFRRDIEAYNETSSNELRIKINHYVFSPKLETIRNFIRDKPTALK